ncbi:hypothetical protein KJ611_02245 [Patescibacteria group bacterium]|nr:hypothetical protein [Patescibacteria group bacterium]MBU1705524.1 hypothetical protein [Patescibacteria group bacterium]
MINNAKYLLLILIILPLAGLGCGQKAAEQAAENRINNALDGQGEIEYTGDGWEYEDSETGTKVQVSERVTIPDDFPNDVPLYPDAVARSVSYNPEQGLAGFVVLVTNDSVEDVMGWYAAQAAKNNWTQNGSFNMDGTSMLMFNQGSRNLNVSAAPSEEDGDFATMLTLSVTER